MKKKILWVILSCLMVLSLLVASCTLAPPAKEDAAPPEQDSQAKSELQILQARYDELSASYDDVKSKLEITQAKYDELSAKHNELSDKYDKLSAKHGELSAKYEGLSAEYDAMIQGTRGINEEDIEQAIFRLVNKERQNNGLNKLEWSDNLHWAAKDHSQHMATIKRLEYSERSYWQGIFQAAGYSTLDRIANAALIIWEESLRYEGHFLCKGAKYGAIGVSKSGDIFYITYFAHTSQLG